MSDQPTSPTLRIQIQDKLLLARGIVDGSNASHMAQLARGVMGTMGLSISSAFLAYFTTWLLARMLGTSGYGAYTYAITWIQLIVIFAGMGLTTIVIRETAKHREQDNISHIRGLLRVSNLTTGIVSFLCVVFGSILLQILGPRFNLDSHTIAALQIALLLIPLMSLSRVYQGMLQGLHRVIAGQSPETLLAPLAFVAALIALYFLNLQLTAAAAMTLRVITTGLAFLLAIVLLRLYRPKSWASQPVAYQTKIWLYAALPLLFIQTVEFTNQRTDQILLGTLGAEAVGIYAVASKGADIITMVLTAFYVVLAPTIARLAVANEHDQLQRVITRGVRGVFLVVLPIGLVLIVGGAWFLGLFGEGFVQGQTTLTILVIVTLINVAFGPVGLLLIMSDQERVVAVGNAIRFVIYVPVSYFLIQQLGTNGAALGKGLSVFCWNLALLLIVYRRLHINTTIFGRIKRSPHHYS